MGKVHTPSSADGAINKICKSLVGFSDHWILKFLVAPVLLTSLPAIILLFFSREQMRVYLPDWAGGKGGVFDQHPVLVVVGAIVFPVLAKALWAGITHAAEPSRKLSVEDLVILTNALGEVVGEKLTRFAGVGKSWIGNPRKRELHEFMEIAKPKEQIRLLAKAIYGLFNSIDSTAEFRVGLIRISDGKPIEWIAYFPAGRIPRMSPEDLSVPTSTVSRAIKHQRAVIVEDIKKELDKKNKDDRNFVKGVASNEAGSQLCYPITDSLSGRVAFVITVAGNSSGSLRKASLPIYEWLIERVAVRIQVENCLEVMGKSHDEKAEAEAA